jgi:DNA gyrase/topoisomerase IV subunit A
VTTYQRQGRGGKGRFGAMAKNDDYVEHLFIASTHAYLMVFTDDGLVYKMKVHEVPDAAGGVPRESGREPDSNFYGAANSPVWCRCANSPKGAMSSW